MGITTKFRAICGRYCRNPGEAGGKSHGFDWPAVERSLILSMCENVGYSGVDHNFQVRALKWSLILKVTGTSAVCLFFGWGSGAWRVPFDGDIIVFLVRAASSVSVLP